MITARWRIMVVVLRTPPSAARLPSSDARGMPPRDPVAWAAQVIAWGAEVRVLDQDAEQMSERTVRREVKLWRADLVILWAGGSMIAARPLPDVAPLDACMAGWESTCPIVLMGPLGKRHGRELLERYDALAAVLPSGASKEVAHRWVPDDHPGSLVRRSDGIALVPGEAPPFPAELLPAWHLLKLEAYDTDAPGARRRIEILAGATAAEALEQAGHAVRRAGARFLVFADRDLGANAEELELLTRGMSGVVPGVPWACRVKADRLIPSMALQLLRGGCTEVLVASPSDPGAPGLAPMDDPRRSRIEAAVDAVRTTGMSPVVEHVIGRPGHTREILAAWWRWFSDRRMVVRPCVLIRQPNERGEGGPGLEEALERAGRWDNDLDSKEISRAIRALTNRSPAGALA